MAISAVGAIASAAIAGGASLIGSARSGSQAEGLAKYQLDYQRDMSGSAHQRQMADLRAAGLNPILSARLGGAGNVSPAGASIPDYGRSASAAIQAANAYAGVQQKDAQIGQLGAQTKLTEQVAKTEEERTRLTAAQAGLTESQTALTEIKTQLQEYEIPKGKAGEMFWDALGAAIHGVTTAKDLSSALASIRNAFATYGVRRKRTAAPPGKKEPLTIKIPYKDN